MTAAALSWVAVAVSLAVLFGRAARYGRKGEP